MSSWQKEYVTDIEHPDEVVWNENIPNTEIYIWKPDGTLLGHSNNDLVINDVLIQIKKKKLKGYYASVTPDDNKQCEINDYGHIPNPAAGMFATYSLQLRTLYLK